MLCSTSGIAVRCGLAGTGPPFLMDYLVLGCVMGRWGIRSSLGLAASGLCEPLGVQGAPPPCTWLLHSLPRHLYVIIPFCALSSVVITHKILRKARGNLEVMPL